MAWLMMHKDQMIQARLNEKLSQYANDYALEISYESIQINGLNELILFGLRAYETQTNPNASKSLLFTLAQLSVELEKSSLFSILNQGLSAKNIKQSIPKIKKVAIVHPVLYTHQSNPKTTIKEIKELAQRFLDRHQQRNKAKNQIVSEHEAHDQDDARGEHDQDDMIYTDRDSFDQRLDALLAKLPEIDIQNGQLLSSKEGVWIHQINGALREGIITGSFYAHRPKLFECQFAGRTDELSLECTHPFAYPLNKNLEVTGKKIKWMKYPFSAIQLSGVKINYRDAQAKQSKNQQISLSLILGLNEDEFGQRKVKLRLDFLSSGGKIEADGMISKEKGQLTTKLQQFPLQSLSAQANGTLSANLNINLSLKSQTASFNGQISGENLVIQHEALSEEAIGPFDLNLGGEIEARWQQKLTELGMSVSLRQGHMKINQIDTYLNASFDNLGDSILVEANASMSKINAKDFAVSIPNGLLPHLQPIELEGELGFEGELKLNTADLDRTVLDVKSELKKLKVISHNEAINFEKLKTQFTTNFEMPDGTIYTREVGPLTDRWTPLSQIPELFPKSVVAQEDGGFYRHTGISMMALRDSLIDNLKQGKFVRGGSTITMQLVKNLFLHRKKTLSRKIEELCITWLLEQNLTKDEMMTLYLNVVEFGTDVFGIKEASQKYFSKSPEYLSPEEIVALTRLLPGPRLFEKFFIEKKLSPNYTSRVNRHLKLLEERLLLSPDAYHEITPTSLWDTTNNGMPNDQARPQEPTNENIDETELIEQ